MKKILILIFLILLFPGKVWSLPDCDKSAHWDNWNNCFGVMKLANGERYSGEWQNGLKQGQGNHIYNDGSEYNGSFKVVNLMA